MGQRTDRPVRHQRVLRAHPRRGPRRQAEHDVTLYEEQAVVETRAVPKERVRLTTEEVTEEETVTGEVRKERIETEGTDEQGDQRPRP
ncbi:DUF2382 domain-containing protein [Streptomyces luteogriseus]|uniref:DUF2382 domain-containing protein n=1 Tax=Streptomyces luteogriseus TaxID=68233 RepID=UPI003678D265